MRLNASHKPIFYGWWIALGGMAVLTISSGIGFFGHTLLLDPLRAEFGWSKGTVSSAVTLFLFVAAIAGSIVGSKIDKYGPTPVLVFGSLCMGLGFTLLSRIQELWELYAVYVLLAIGWSSSYAVPISTLIANWFVRKRGLAMSVAMTGMSLGGIVVVPLASHLLLRLGLRETLPFFGLTFWVIIIPIALFLLKKRPAVLGLYPDGDMPRSPQEEENNASAGSSQMVPWTRRQAMRTKVFWCMVVAFFLVLGSQASFMIHMVSFLNPFLGPAPAAGAVSLMTGVSFCGRLLVGSFIDRINKRIVTIACFLLQGGALFTVAQSSDVVVLYICVCAFGLTIGNIIMMQSLIIGECFGMVSFGKISGLAMLFTSCGSAFGPAIAGILFDMTQSYRTGFTFFAFTYVLSALVVVLVKPALSRPDYPSGTLALGSVRDVS